MVENHISTIHDRKKSINSTYEKKINRLKELENEAAQLRNDVYSSCVKRYVACIQSFFKLPRNMVATIVTLLQNLDSENCVFLTDRTRETILKDAGICRKTLTTRVSFLTKYGILEKTDTLERHRVSPFFFGSTGWRGLVESEELKFSVSIFAEGYELTTSLSSDRKIYTEFSDELV